MKGTDSMKNYIGSLYSKENMKYIHKKFVELITPREEILDFFSFHEKEIIL